MPTIKHRHVDDVGSLFVKAGAISEPQLERARRIVAKLKEQKTVGELLVELGQLSRDDHDRILSEYRGTLSLAGILHEQGVLNDETLELFERARAERPDVDERVLLVEEGGCPETKYLEALEIKYDIPIVYPEIALVDRQHLANVSVPYLVRKESLPMSVVEGELLVIMAEPLNKSVILALEEALGQPIKPCSAPRDFILDALQTLEGWRSNPDAAPDSKVQYHELSHDAEEDEPGEEVVQLVDHVLIRAIQLGASDVHFEPMPTKLRVRARVDGVMRVLNDLPPDFAARLASRIKILAGADIAERQIIRMVGLSSRSRENRSTSVFPPTPPYSESPSCCGFWIAARAWCRSTSSGSSPGLFGFCVMSLCGPRPK